MKSEAERILYELATFLLKNDYALYTELLSSKHRFNDYHFYVDEEELGRIGRTEQNLIKLFFLGRRLDKNEDMCLPESLCTDLQYLGLIIDYGADFDFGGYYIFPLHGLLLIADRRAKEKTIKPDIVWLDDDSVFFYKLLPSFQGCTVLDLGTGSGIQAIHAARNGGDVTAIEINPKAAEIARWNSYLNGKKIRVLQGNLYEPLEREAPELKFDYIISNPPYLPTAKQKESFYFADGGDDGLQVLKAILYESHKYLTPSGKLIIISGCFGTEDKLQVEEVFKTDPRLSKMSFHFFTIYKKKIEPAMNELKLLLPGMAEGINANVEDKKRFFSHYYAFICLVKLSSRKARLTVTDSVLTNTRRLKIMRNIY
jgi:release factor glutamine methyltransferase